MRISFNPAINAQAGSFKKNTSSQNQAAQVGNNSFAFPKYSQYPAFGMANLTKDGLNRLSGLGALAYIRNFSDAIETKNTSNGLKTIEDMEKQDADTQKTFALSVNNDKNTQFNVALNNNQPELAKAFLEFASKVVPAEAAKWEIPQAIQQDEQFIEIAKRIASSPELSKDETLKFLRKNNA